MVVGDCSIPTQIVRSEWQGIPPNTCSGTVSVYVVHRGCLGTHAGHVLSTGEYTWVNKKSSIQLPSRMLG